MIRIARWWVAALAFVFLLPSGAAGFSVEPGDILLGGEEEILRVDPQTGKATSLLPVSDFRGGLAVASDQSLLATTRSSLIRIDRATDAVEVLATFSADFDPAHVSILGSDTVLVGGLLTTDCCNGGSSTAVHVAAVEDGVATTWRTVSGIFSIEQLANDGTTAWFTDSFDGEVVGVTPDTLTIPYSGVGSGSNGGIAVDSGGHLIVAETFFSDPVLGFPGPRILRIDPLTGSFTELAFGFTSGQMGAVALEADGSILVGSSPEFLVGGASDLWRINPRSGAARLLGSADDLGAWRSMAVVPIPEPSTLLLVAVGLAGPLLHRRRRLRRAGQPQG